MTALCCPHGIYEEVPLTTDFRAWRSSHCGLGDPQAARAALHEAAEETLPGMGAILRQEKHRIGEAG